MFNVAKTGVAAVSALFGLVAGGDTVATSITAESAGATSGGDAAVSSTSSGDKRALAVLNNADGETIAAVKMTSLHGDNVKVTAAARDVRPAGAFHGFHIHETGVCNPPFTSAGDHYNPDSTDHGQHAGDLPPLSVTDNGEAATSFVTDRFTVDELFNDDGSAIIIHDGSDNLANIPQRYHSHTEDVRGPDSETRGAGDAGDRLACGVLTRPDTAEPGDSSLPTELRNMLQQ